MPKSFNFLSPLPWKSTELYRNITSRSTTQAHPAFAAEGWAQPGIIRPGLMVFAVLKWIFVAGGHSRAGFRIPSGSLLVPCGLETASDVSSVVRGFSSLARLV